MRKPREIVEAFSLASDLDGITSFFLVGIGGAGMSALARMLAARGFQVKGTDSTASIETSRLTKEGIQVHIGHTGRAIQPDDALVVTDAIDLETSPEVARAKELGIPVVRRSQALGWVLKPYKVIAVTGTHGKTTTTAMLGAGLIAAGQDPLVVVGAAIPEWGGPVREGQGEYAVVEACEAYDSFHDIQPYIVVLTNLELDHVDFHGCYENLRASVVRFADSVPPNGWLVYCSEDRGASEVAELSSSQAVPYGASEEWVRQIVNMAGGVAGELPRFPSENTLFLPGRHNLLNAAGALTAAALVRADLEKVEEALRVFRGAERRLQVLKGSPITVIDDYAHHPSEIVASLNAIRDRYFTGENAAQRLIVVFQPHLYSRTAPLIPEFAQALSVADEVVITDIYPAREAPMAGVSSARIAELIDKPVQYVPSRHLLPRIVAGKASVGDVIVGMGAGNISEFAPAVVKELERKDRLAEGRRACKVAVIYAGDSAEREVSNHSGLAVHAALTRKGYDATLVDVTDLLLRGKSLHDFVGESRPDVAFLAVHGTNAEDGAIQGLLELLHLPYTGSGIQSSAICMDKALTKQILEAKGIRTPKGVLLNDFDDPVSIPPPVVVKPNAQGSTVGLSFVDVGDDLCSALRKAFAYGEQVLVEEWVRGMEISTPVLEGKALMPVEIVPASGRYDFASKYLPGATEEIVPARLPGEILKTAQEVAILAHRALGCEGATRTDAIVRGDEMFVLEVNTLPGLTATSLLPNSAAACGISFDDLCARLVEDALARHAAKT
ncbi:MAG TPA: UDP-N-acetylmuramate--L-alanine ligase [Fimbriimonas sp.]|nr:UDP-N-acetylmuramate--L-alanine ligase [Fimbriimonas sp.]